MTARTSGTKIVVITGAASGIGAAISHRLGEDGVVVAAWDVNIKGSTEVCDSIRAAGGHAQPFEVDVSDAAAVNAACDRVVAEIGPPTMLVNCAGIRDICDPLELESEQWRRVMGVNLDGAFYCTAAVGRVMARSGGGVIVNIASIAAMDAYADRTAYVASKHGLLGLTRSTALDLAKHNIRVNAVAPGLMASPMTEAIADEPATRSLLERTPQRRWGKPEEIADAVAYLLSDRAAFITGVMLPVDGGRTVAR